MADDRRTEKPTGRRLLRARGDGQFVTSRDMIAAAQMSAFVLMIGSWFPAWFSSMKSMLRESLTEAFHGDLVVARVPGILSSVLQRAFIPLAGLAVVAMLAPFLVHLKVSGFAFSTKRLQIDFTRFNPVPKIKGTFTQAPFSVLQVLGMLVAFTATIYMIMSENTTVFLALPFASLDIGLAKLGASIKDLLWRATGVFIVFGFIDWFRQQRRFTKSLMMTKQETKDEAKEMESNPHVRFKLKRMRRDLLRRKMMKAVPTASAVIVNPTHFAVALRYKHETMATPVVIAKGKNFLALRIRQIAIESGVPLVENPPLAQALYKSVEVGNEIPPALYRAVAEVLAYIHRLQNTRRVTKPRVASRPRR